MALEYGFFNAVENSGTYDREVGQVFFTELLKAVFKTGISTNSFIASAGTGLTVNLTSGRGAIDGVFFCDTSASTVTLTAATGTRTDLIVARLNTASRNVEIAVKQGTTAVASNEVAIATATVTGSAITSVSNATRTNIIDSGIPNISYGTGEPTGGNDGDIYFKIES